MYYLWLVVPFVTELTVLTDPTHIRPTSPQMWKFPLDATSWPAAKLDAVMQRQTHRYLDSPVLNTSTYRQLAIAISRTHLRSGGFKLDYGIEQKAIDAQAAHESNLAGTIYARELQQARGQLEARRAIFRAVSREWHEFLGFATPRQPRKHGLDQDSETRSCELYKRSRRTG